ncbi:MAG: alkaline phosphatase [bacterium]
MRDHSAQPDDHCLPGGAAARLFFVLLLVLLLSGVPAITLSSSGPPAGNERAGEPVRIILLIADGAGAAQWTSALLSAGSLHTAALPVGGMADTRADPQIVTDSAAAATALACGIMTCNGAIGMDGEGRPAETVLERAEARGMATGLVATSSLTHATPAAFAAHRPRRGMLQEIAEDMARQPMEVMLGGGRGHFDGSRRRDGRDLLSEYGWREGTVVTDPLLFETLDLDGVERLAGLFAADHLPSISEGRRPSLAAMTAAALEVLDADPDGFFLMVEGSQPDWRCHDRRPLEEVAAEMLDFDGAVGAALAYQAERPGTLIVVTADHETAGLSLHPDGREGMEARYGSGAHTPSLVPLFAGGPGAGAFGGLKPLWRIGRLLLEAVDR